MGLIEEEKNFENDSNGSETSSYDEEEVIVKVVREEGRKSNYSKINEELLNVIEKRRTSESLHYEDVGEDLHIKVTRDLGEDFGLNLICGEVFTPSWPAIIDIKRDSPASRVNLKIGDQIKELAGTDTSTLLHWQLVGLFNSASEEISMTVRRGIDRSHTKFDWYKYPFSSVRQDYEEVVIGDAKKKPVYHRGKCQGSCKCSLNVSRNGVALKTFRIDGDCKPQNENTIVCQRRTMSQSSIIRRDLFNKGVERSRLNRNSKGLDKSRDFVYPTSEQVSMERLYDEKGQLEVGRRSLSNSSSSMSSTMSDSTASSSTTYSEQTSVSNPGSWLDRMTNPYENAIYSEETFEEGLEKSIDGAKYFAKSAGNKITESFRRRKKKKDGSGSRTEEIKYTVRRDESENTLLLTVWVIDRRKLGLHLGGGSVSAYGDSNVKVVDIKKTGTGFGIFRVGDEILEISGVITNGLNVYDVNRIISNLEGQYVEFKIFRPKCH